jgi:sugar-phosphatase
LGLTGSECVVMEDVPAGIRAGKAAGARVIAFRTTAAEADLQRAGADFILNNCSDVVVAHDSAGLTLILNATRGGNSPR